METYLKSNSSLLWGIVAVVVGLTLMIWPDDILPRAMWLIGVLSLLIGVIQFLGFLARTRGLENRWKYFPFACLVAIIWGALLLIGPEIWSNLFIILLGVLLIFLGLNQLISLGRKRRRKVPVGWTYFIFPVLMFVAGFAAFMEPVNTAAWFMIFIGAWIFAYGVSEIFQYFTLRDSGPELPPADESPEDTF